MKKFLKTPFQIGTVTLPNNVFYSPLAGCSDFPFRKMAARFQPGLMFCEMVKMEALVRFDRNTLRILDYDSSMRPIGAQLCGSNPLIAGQAAKIIEDLGFDTLDFNCGCPVDKVTKDGSGSGMLKQIDRIGEILTNMTSAVKIPVTVKIRAGWDENSIIVGEVTKIAESAGAKAIAIHGRTREQGYTGPANWDYIKQAVEARNSILVIGNGDVFSKEKALEMFETTGCDAVLVSRGTLGSPWIVQEIMEHLLGNSTPTRNISDRKEALLEHLDHMLSYYPDEKTVLEMRKVGCWYIKDSFGTKRFRSFISKGQSIEEIKRIITEFPVDLPLHN